MLAACAAAPKATGPTPGSPTEAPAAAATPATADPKPPGLRLPAGVRPTSYRAFLDIDPEETGFRGLLHIELQVDQPTSVIWLHGEKLNVKSVEVSSGTKARAFVAPGGFLGIALAAPLPAGKATLEIGYEGGVDSVRSQGLYRVKEPDGKWYAYTFFEPVDARRVFPCFDEPSFKVPWKLAIRTPASNVAATNTRMVAEHTEDGHRLVEFEETRPLPSYLIAFMVGPFQIVDAGSAGNHGTPLRFIVPPGHEEELRYAKQATPRAVALLEDWFGMPYPYGKLDVAVVPRYWGTMEHPGIVAMGQPLTLIKSEEETLERKRAYANILIHELGHYWFGDYVTMAWWNETWLNEGMGSWMDMKITDAFEPAWKYWRGRIGSRSAAMSADAKASAKALRQPVGESTDVESSFDNQLTYAKGASVLFMFEHWIGEARFQKAIRAYLDAHKWGNAVSEDLIAAISAEAGRDLAPALKSFIDQPGVPIVSVELSCEKGQPPALKLAQKRFRPLGTGAEAKDSLWQIPMCIRWGQGKNKGQKCDLLADASASWPLVEAKKCPDWVLGNVDGYGYYRVAYTPAGRAALVKVARSALSPVERHGLLGDTSALVQSGELPLGELLALAESTLGDPDPLVFGAARGMLGWVDPDKLPALLMPNYRRMIKKLLGPQARRLGWNEKPGESNDDHEMRASIMATVARWGEAPKLRDEAIRMARAWLADRKAIAHDLSGTVLHVAAYFGDRALFDAYLAEARKTGDREERAMLLGALAGFADPELVKAAQQLGLSGEFDVRDGGGLLYAGLGEPATREMAWQFVKDHFDEIAAKLRDDEKMWSLGVAGRFCDAEHRKDAEAFFSERAKKINGGPRALARTLEGVDQCIALREKNAPEIAAFLKKF